MHRRRLEMQLLHQLDVLRWRRVRMVGDGLPDLHDRAAQMAETAQRFDGHAEMRFCLDALAYRRAPEPAAHPRRNVDQAGLRLQVSQREQAAHAAQRQRLMRQRRKLLGQSLFGQSAFVQRFRQCVKHVRGIHGHFVSFLSAVRPREGACRQGRDEEFNPMIEQG